MKYIKFKKHQDVCQGIMGRRVPTTNLTVPIVSTLLWSQLGGTHLGQNLSQAAHLERQDVRQERSPTLHEGHRGMFNIHKLMREAGTSSLTSIRGKAHTLMNRSACETTG